MPRPTSYNRMCFPKAIMEFHARRRSTVCAVQKWCWHVTPYVVRQCLRSKAYDGMPRPTSFDRVCCPRAVDS